MLKRKDLETILHINGVSPADPDEQIRSVLLSARYDNKEVDTAIMILRENTVTRETRMEGLHKIFRSNEGLKPDEISSLLGIDVNFDEVISSRAREQAISFWQTAIITIIAIIIALCGVLTSMYVYKVGLFHPTVSAFGGRF